jgi:4-amino-4-deoxy-L-arabinose transferase-like glycosyltransferase
MAALVYLACGILLRIRQQRESWISFILLGLTLAFGYLGKTVMFPLSFIFLALALFLVGNLRRAVPRTLVALIVFFLIAGPFIVAISRTKARFTFGDSGRINYSWIANGVSHHWQGDRSGNGAPTHPPRKISDMPAIYEFGNPVAGTYPMHYDPSYWYEGGVSHFDVRGQLRSLWAGVKVYYELFFSNIQYGLFVGFLSLYLMSRRRWLLVYDLAPYWCLIIPAMAGLGIYALINVQSRYVAAFVVLLWLGLFAGLRMFNNQESKRSIACVTVVLMTMMVLTVTASSSSEAYATAHSLIAGEDPSAHKQWRVAEGLHQMGVEPGDKVAVIGDSFSAYWAHLLRLHIVAEISPEDADTFWAADPATQKVAIDTLARTGARVIVTEKPPFRADPIWQKIGNSDYYAYLLSK